MVELVVGLGVFLGIHIFPSFPQAKEKVLQRFGVKLYAGVFSSIALIGMIIIVIGKMHAEYHELWTPPVWGKRASMLVIPVAFILLVASYLPNNLQRYLRHPMLWGVLLWAVAHLMTNGDMASVTLFAALAVYALFAMISANVRGIYPKSDQEYALSKDLSVILIGILLYAAFTFLHPFLFGVAVVDFNS